MGFQILSNVCIGLQLVSVLEEEEGRRQQGAGGEGAQFLFAQTILSLAFIFIKLKQAGS